MRALLRRSLLVMCCLALPRVTTASPYPRTLRELIGRAAPALRARDVRHARPITLRQLRGRLVLLFFSASWCRPCHVLEPTLEAFVRRLGPKRVTLLALSHESRKRLLRHLRPRPAGYLVGQCTGATALRYAARSIPTLVLIDGAGVVRRAWQGIDPRRLPRLLRAVEALAGANREGAAGADRARRAAR